MYLCTQRYQVYSKVPGVGALSPDHFSRPEMHLQLIWGVPVEYLVFGFPVIGLCDNFSHRKFCWRLGETAWLPFPRAISKQQFPFLLAKLGMGLFQGLVPFEGCLVLGPEFALIKLDRDLARLQHPGLHHLQPPQLQLSPCL